MHATPYYWQKKKFEGLPKDIQRIFEAITREENVRLTAEFSARNGAALDTLVRQHGVQLKRFPNDVLTAYGKASGEVIAELRETGDDITKRIVESFLKARREQMGWSRIGEQEFMNARLLDSKFG